MSRCLRTVFSLYVIRTTSQTVIILYGLWKYEGLKTIFANNFNEIPSVYYMLYSIFLSPA